MAQVALSAERRLEVKVGSCELPLHPAACLLCRLGKQAGPFHSDLALYSDFLLKKKKRPGNCAAFNVNDEIQLVSR